jgi:hypothetical protein
LETDKSVQNEKKAMDSFALPIVHRDFEGRMKGAKETGHRWGKEVADLAIRQE